MIIRCTAEAAEAARAATYRYFKTSRISVQNTTEEHAEFIFEIKRFEQAKTDAFLKELYAGGGIECANFVLQEDKTSV